MLAAGRGLKLYDFLGGVGEGGGNFLTLIGFCLELKQ